MQKGTYFLEEFEFFVFILEKSLHFFRYLSMICEFRESPSFLQVNQIVFSSSSRNPSFFQVRFSSLLISKKVLFLFSLLIFLHSLSSRRSFLFRLWSFICHHLGEVSCFLQPIEFTLHQLLDTMFGLSPWTCYCDSHHTISFGWHFDDRQSSRLPWRHAQLIAWWPCYCEN